MYLKCTNVFDTFMYLLHFKDTLDQVHVVSVLTNCFSGNVCVFVSIMVQVPRMIVNVVQILPMETLREVHKPTPGCLLQR